MVKIYLSKCIFLSETGDCLDGAIVTDGGNIAFVGDRQEALQEFPEGKVIDLGNRTHLCRRQIRTACIFVRRSGRSGRCDYAEDEGFCGDHTDRERQNLSDL